MLRSWVGRHHRLVFFGALYAAYVAVLFLAVGAHDEAHASRSLVRLAAPLVELSFAGLLCAGCMRLALRGPRAPWLVVSAAIATAAAVVYFAQAYSLLVSNNFISVLAMANADSAGFVRSPSLVVGMAVAVAWVGLFVEASWRAAGAPPTAHGAAVRWGTGRYAATTFALGLLSTYLLFIQGPGLRLEPGFRQSPAANLMVNAYRFRFAAPSLPTAAAPESGMACFAYPDDPPGGAEFPFLHTGAWDAALPYPRVADAPAGAPNIIVVFAEGVSARLVGAYGGSYPGLTPNLDALAADAMRVDDYFNHTAATFRGLEGQLSSGFSYAGGGGKEGWTHPHNQAALLAIRRRTVPQVVNAAGYESHFFAPHRQERALVVMLDALGFGQVHTYQSIGQDLLEGEFDGRPGTTALDDQSLFRGIVEFLERRDASGNDRPFFLATYNIGTHAFLERSGNDVAYGDLGNPVLDRLHNFDAALGDFLRYFHASPYARNTILVVTSDHATYPEPPFREVAGDDLKPYFVDRIPLLVVDPFHDLPDTLDAAGRTSLAFAPTLLQLAGLPPGGNAFLGRSLFESRNFPLGIAALGSKYYLTAPDGVFAMDEIPPDRAEAFRCQVEVVRRFYAAERDNRLVPPGPAHRMRQPTATPARAGR